MASYDEWCESLQRFDDLWSDVSDSSYQMFENNLARFMVHLSDDEAIATVTKPLRSVADFELEAVPTVVEGS